MASVDDNVLEVIVERWFKRRLENVGFKVVKLVTPGYSGPPDRLILFPRYAPSPPAVAEIKRFAAKARALQLFVHRDWAIRGVRVLEVIDGKETAMRVSDMLIAEVQEAYREAKKRANVVDSEPFSRSTDPLAKDYPV